MATLKFLSRSREGTVSTVSHLSGRPASTDGNRRERRRRGSPDSIARLMIGLNLEARRGVVTTVTVTPCCANNLAMSIMGMKWPGAIRVEEERKPTERSGFIGRTLRQSCKARNGVVPCRDRNSVQCKQVSGNGLASYRAAIGTPSSANRSPATANRFASDDSSDHPSSSYVRMLIDVGTPSSANRSPATANRFASHDSSDHPSSSLGVTLIILMIHTFFPISYEGFSIYWKSALNRLKSTEQVQGVLNLIDLACSERISKSGSTGDRLKETHVCCCYWFVIAAVAAATTLVADAC
ncbi:unnamed protein product [Camellia sinensis]